LRSAYLILGKLGNALYTGILDEDLGQQAIIAGSISLIVFDPIKEEIIQWIP